MRAGEPDCKLPRPHELRKSAFGDSFADAAGARYQLFLADTLAAAIGDLANASKAISGGKLFTMSYFGYDLRTPQRTACSLFCFEIRFLAAGLRRTRTQDGCLPAGIMSQLTLRPEIDAICSTSHYDDRTRNVTGPFVVNGLLDPMAAAGKLLVAEDDSRTFWSGKVCATCSEVDTTNIARRNVATVALHGAAIYQFDLSGGGWWGTPNTLNTSTARVWANITAVRKAALNAASSPSPGSHWSGSFFPVGAEVAVFLDDAAPKARTTLAGFAHTNNPTTDDYNSLGKPRQLNLDAFSQ